jgi:hypothetical protein
LETEPIEYDCFEIGEECEEHACDTCTIKPGCGWCGATNTCKAAVNKQPYCHDCTENWHFDTAKCPKSAASAHASMDKQDKAAYPDGTQKAAKPYYYSMNFSRMIDVFIGLVILVVLLALAGGVRVLYKRRKAAREGQYSVANELNAVTSEMMDKLGRSESSIHNPINTDDLETPLETA